MVSMYTDGYSDIQCRSVSSTFPILQAAGRIGLFLGSRQDRSLFKFFLEKYHTNRPILPASCKIRKVELSDRHYMCHQGVPYSSLQHMPTRISPSRPLCTTHICLQVLVAPHASLPGVYRCLPPPLALCLEYVFE